MNVQQAYNEWAAIYDSNENKTRDLEALALREILSPLSFSSCLEMGCGTGKNTAWLQQKTKQLLCVDLSEEMLRKAKEKITTPHVSFIQVNMNNDWNFTSDIFDLATFSLVLEHIENLDAVFEQLAKKIRSGGYVYIGELHPFKQYAGTKARFETATGTQVVTCFTHHISDFVQPALKHDFSIMNIKEYFDEGDVNTLPRIITFLLKKN